jgi:hypothetical protein
VENLVRQTSTSFLGLLSKALRTNYDRVAEEPLPERWVDLINHLNEREKAEQPQDRHADATPGSLIDVRRTG